jgi:hypothetical protein
VRRLIKLLPLALALTLAACATLTPIPETDPALVACEAFAPIRYSRLQDTEETIRQVREHNAVYAALCPIGAE